MLGAEIPSAIRRNRTFEQYRINSPNRKDVKPLSRCKNESLCAEYTLLTHHLLDKLNIRSTVIIGALNTKPDGLADRHTYLTLAEGRIVFDPMLTLSLYQTWPLAFLYPEKPITHESISDLSTDSSQKFGVKILCHNPINQDQFYYGSGAV